MALEEKFPPQKEEVLKTPEISSTQKEKQASPEDLAKMAQSLREGLKAEINTTKSTADALKNLKEQEVLSKKQTKIAAEKPNTNESLSQKEDLENNLNPSFLYTPDDSIYPTSSLKRTDELLNTNLESPLLDAEGFAKGLIIDSWKSVFKLVTDLIKDTVYLIPDILQARNKS